MRLHTVIGETPQIHVTQDNSDHSDSDTARLCFTGVLTLREKGYTPVFTISRKRGLIFEFLIYTKWNENSLVLTLGIESNSMCIVIKKN